MLFYLMCKLNFFCCSNFDAPAYSIPTAAVNSGRSSPQTVESETSTQSLNETDGGFGGQTTERSSEFSLEDVCSLIIKCKVFLI